jgi:hypothetical protein
VQVRTLSAVLTLKGIMKSLTTAISLLIAGTLPVSAQVLNWNTASTWPNGRTPKAGEAVVIPAGKTIRLNTNPPALGRLEIQGTLLINSGTSRQLTATRIAILGSGKLQVGSATKAYPASSKVRITLNEQSSDKQPSELCDMSSMGGPRVLMGIRGLTTCGGTLEIYGSTKTPWSRLAAPAQVGATTLALTSAPTGWRVGDKLGITSSQVNPGETEERTITEISGSTITLDAPLAYQHWGGKSTVAGFTIDESAEVANLTRNVVISGVSPTQATHVMSMGRSKIQAVAFENAGQEGTLGRYPWHDHLKGNAVGDFLRNSVSAGSLNRCFAIHGTNGLAYIGNVCWKSKGHGFFIAEDGNESGNIVDGNLSWGQTPTSALLQGELHPASIWIGNPNNQITNNTTGGIVTGHGIWYELPPKPTGFAANGADAQLDVRRQPMGANTGNTVHSTSGDAFTSGGFFIENYFRDAVVSKLTAYHNTRAFWGARGDMSALPGSGLHSLVDSLLADNDVGVFGWNVTAQNSVFIKETDNIERCNGGFMLLCWNGPGTVVGVQAYDGKVYSRNNTFVNYVPSADPNRSPTAGAFGPAGGHLFFSATFDAVDSGSKFINSWPYLITSNGQVGLTRDGFYTEAGAKALLFPDCTQGTPTALNPRFQTVFCRGKSAGNLALFNYDSRKFPSRYTPTNELGESAAVRSSSFTPNGVLLSFASLSAGHEWYMKTEDGEVFDPGSHTSLSLLGIPEVTQPMIISLPVPSTIKISGSGAIALSSLAELRSKIDDIKNGYYWLDTSVSPTVLYIKPALGVWESGQSWENKGFEMTNP